MRIQVPDPSLIVLCGPAGSGKTTFAASRFPATAVVSSDRCRAMLAGDERNLAVSREAFELFYCIIDRRLRFRRLTVADSTALRRTVRAQLLAIGRRHAVPVVAIVFDVDVERCLRQDALRARRVGRPVIERHVGLLHETLRTIGGEGFDRLYVLDEVAARTTSIERVPGAPPADGKEDCMEARVDGTVIRLVQGDITQQQVDAIVNAANERLVGGGGVDGAIRRAGGPEIEAACARIRAEQGGCPTGQAVLTPAGRLPARFVIHAVGPRWQGGHAGEAEQLASAYRASLALAAQHGARTVAFPSISTGVFGYPVEEAARVAVRTVADAVRGLPLDEVRFVLFSAGDLDAYARALRQEVGGTAG